MNIEKSIPQGEAVQPVDEIQSPKKSLAQKYRYLVIGALVFPGSFSLPIGCATYAYNHFKGADQTDSDSLKTVPVIQKVERLAPSFESIAHASTQP